MQARFLYALFFSFLFLKVASQPCPQLSTYFGKTQIEELRRAIFELRNMHKMRDISDALVRINSIENHADDIFDNAKINAE